MLCFGILSLSSVKAPQWVLSGSGGVLPFIWSVCTLFCRRVPKLGPPQFLPQRTNSLNSLSFFTIILSFCSTVFVPWISIGIIDALAGSFFLRCLKKDLELVLIPLSTCFSNSFFALPNYIFKFNLLKFKILSLDFLWLKFWYFKAIFLFLSYA